MITQMLMIKMRTSKVLLIALLVFICKDFVFVPALAAQDNPAMLLKKGVQAYQDADFKGAVESLNKALKSGLKKSQDQEQAYQYLAFANAAIGDSALAIQAYVNVLEINADFELPVSASPRLRGPFLAARKLMAERDKDAPEIVLRKIEAVEAETALTIRVEVRDASAVESVVLRYKNNADDPYKIIQLQSENGSQFVCTIPAQNVQPPGVFYYLEAIDQYGNGPARKGTAESPLYITVTRSDVSPPRIAVNEIESTEAETPVSIQAKIDDASGVDHAILYYRVRNEQSFRAVSMKKQSGDVYTAEIENSRVRSPGLEYYVEAFDAAGNGPGAAGTNQKPLFISVITPDRQPPLITHTPPGNDKQDSVLTITARIHDNTGVKRAVLCFKTSTAETYTTMPMEPSGKEVYKAEIPWNVMRGPALLYYIAANDAAGNVGYWESSVKPYVLVISKDPVQQPVVADADQEQSDKKKSGGKKWLWIGLGAAALGGAVVALVGGGGEKGETKGYITVSIPVNQ